MPEPSSIRRKHNVLWFIGLLLLLCVAWFAFQLFGQNPPIVVSKETTFITEPLGEDGLPDFVAHLRNRASEGVTPENNAAVLTWQAMWPGELAQKHWLPMAEALGLKAIPSEQESLVPVHDSSVREAIVLWLAKKDSDSPETGTTDDFLNGEVLASSHDWAAEELIGIAGDRPWRSGQCPPLATWVKNNQQPLNLLVEASTRPHYYSPKFPNGSDDSLIAMLLPDIQTMRSAIRAIMVRAMWHLGEGRNVEAWQNIQACHRLARLLPQKSTLVEQLVAIAIDSVACRGTITMLHHGELRPDEARQILADLNALSRVSLMSQSLDQGERLFFIDSVIRMAEGKMGGEDLTVASGGPMQAVSFVAIDWNLILCEGNRWYDRFVAALQLPTRVQQKAEFQKINADLVRLGTTTTGPQAIIGSILSRRKRSQTMANVLLSLLLPALEAAMSAEERSIATLDLTRVAAALAVYRAEHDEYPEKLADMVPGILSEMPLDLYSDQPFLYERKADGGYLLYSVFDNGVDDGGSDMGGEIVAGEWLEGQPEDFDYEASDLVIRVPVPAFKLPELAKEEQW